MSSKRTKLIVGGVLAAALVAGGTAIAVGGSGEHDAPLAGSNLDRAKAAALEHTGGGTVLETEIGDDGAAYGVEIRLENGSVVEVNLDADFDVIGQEADDDGGEDRDVGSDD